MKFLSLNKINPSLILLLKLKYSVKVSRDNLKRSTNFIDLESDDKKDMNMSILPFEDTSFQTKMVETEIAIQVNLRVLTLLILNCLKKFINATRLHQVWLSLLLKLCGGTRKMHRHNTKLDIWRRKKSKKYSHKII